MNKQKSIDLKMGFKSEEDIHEYLETIFGTLLRSKNNPEMGEYYEFDKYNELFYIEMKTRRIKMRQYPTLFFGKNKLIKGDEILKKNPNLRIIYLWRCNDGVVFWEHRSSVFDTSQMGRRDRGRDEIDECVEILQKYIKPINEIK
tara:strand:- start:1099 stop:1533 length:435 start_codon:yes stop_codon:yes gene_type:complete